VAKNLFLSREKSISRKIKEVILAKRMEEELTKGRIIELYLNAVELGPMVYGIGHGARYYFGKPASSLTPRECAFLAAMLPGPRIAYNPYKKLSKVAKRSDMILRLLRAKGVLSDDEYRLAITQKPNIAGLQRKVDFTIAREEAVQTPMTSALQLLPGAEAVPAEEEMPGAADKSGAQPANSSGTDGAPPLEELPEKAPLDGSVKE
jgi:monofunctional glycosyltransferase